MKVSLKYYFLKFYKLFTNDYIYAYNRPCAGKQIFYVASLFCGNNVTHDEFIFIENSMISNIERIDSSVLMYADYQKPL